MAMNYEKGHGQYIVECVGNAADAIETDGRWWYPLLQEQPVA